MMRKTHTNEQIDTIVRSVLWTPKAKKPKARIKAGTATFYPRGLCGNGYKRQRPYCRVVAETEKRSSICALCDAPSIVTGKSIPSLFNGSHGFHNTFYYNYIIIIGFFIIIYFV